MTACLMLIDLQHGILRSRRIPWEQPDIPASATTAASNLLNIARNAALPVIHVRVIRPLASGALDIPRSETAAKSGKVPRQILPMARDTPDVEFVLPPLRNEEVIEKIGVSAFAGTRAESLLRNLSASNVIVAGAFTHMAVESTVRQGFDLGFRMSVVAEACCSPTKALHESSLSTGIANFARILRGATAIADVVASSGK